MHVVFLDNGRLALARDPVFSEALRCVRCGSCANVCPIYSLVGGHNYGHVYIGAIGLILTYFYHGRKNDRAIVQNCLNCQACKAVCPAGIDLPHLIKETYCEVLKGEEKLPLKNRLLRRVLKDRRLFHFLLRRASLAQKPLAREKGFIRHLPFFFGKEHEFRSLPVIARIPFRDLWPKLYQKVDQAPLPGGPVRRLPGGLCLPRAGRGPAEAPERPGGAGGVPHGPDLLRPARQDDGGKGSGPGSGPAEPRGPGPGGLRLHPDPVRLLRLPYQGGLPQAAGRGAGGA